MAFKAREKTQPDYLTHHDREQFWRGKGEEAIRAEQERLLTIYFERKGRALRPKDSKTCKIKCGCLHPNCKYCGPKLNAKPLLPASA